MAMHNKYIITILLLFTIVFTQTGKAQENITMYNLLTLPQTSKLNPAHQTDYNGHIGGMITMMTPIFGQITPNLDLNIHSSFAYSEFIYKGTGIYSDSLVLAFNSHADALKFVDKLDKVNSFKFAMNLNIFNFGFRTNKIYWNFNLSNKTSFSTTFPGGLVELIVKGNGSPDISPNVDLSGFGVSALNYNEFGVGASLDILPELRVGGRVKLLSGVAHLETVKSDLHLNTLDNELVLESDIHMRASQPALILDDLYYDFEGDSLVSETTELETAKIISNLTNVLANPGLAVDLGAEYQVLPELKVSASITDLGFISWNTNVAEIRGGGTFRFDGMDAVEYLDDNDDSTEDPNFGETMSDSVLKVLDVRKTGVANYKSWLPTNVYVGGTYNVTNAIGFGALYRGVIYRGDLSSAISLSANANTGHISATISYTIMENNFDNIGIGFAGRFGPIQMYVVSDHMLESVFPQNAKDVNIRLGMNWILGYKKDRAALIE